MALFRCLRSGNIITIDQIDDVERMKTHEGYVLVEEIDHGMQQTTQITEAKAAEEVIEPYVPHKKRGRPVKEALEI